MPVTEHDSGHDPTVKLKPMNRWSMSVAMNQAVDTKAAKTVGHGFRINVQDVRRLAAVAPATDTSGNSGQEASPPQWPRQRPGLPGRITHPVAETLIGLIVGAQAVAVEQGGRWKCVGKNDRLLQPLHAGAGAVVVTDQEVPIAAQEIHFDAAFSQFAQVSGNTIGQVIGTIVADPDFEQVAEDVKRAGPASRAAQEVQQHPGGFGVAGLQVEVGDQVDRAVVGQTITQRWRPRAFRPAR